jgi:hypothetical protein
MSKHPSKARVITALCFGSVTLAMAVVCLAATPKPSTQADGEQSREVRRLTFLGNQLAADEAAVAAINKALVQAGYKAAGAVDQAANAAKGNELMDRKGGGPKRWEEFYGRTAKSFILHDKYSPVYHQVQRPSQFDYIYHANNQQIEAARASVAAMEKRIDSLLKRRRELEAELGALWATIAFESIQNRDIALRALYRYQLKLDAVVVDDNQPEPAQLKAVRAAVTYLRTIDHAIAALLNSLEHNQGAAYGVLRDSLQSASQNLQESAATFADTPNVHAAQAAQMREAASLAKQMQSLCKDICDAHRKALDADAAGAPEEARKQLFRGALQESLFLFAEAAAQLDDTLMKTSQEWKVVAIAGTKNADKLPEIILPAAPATVAVEPTPPKVEVPAAEAQWVDLLNGRDIDNWTATGEAEWKVKDGVLEGRGSAKTRFRDRLMYKGREFGDFHLRVEAMINDGGNSGVFFRTQDAVRGYEAQIESIGPDDVKTGGLWAVVKPPVRIPGAIAPPPPDQWFLLEIIAQGPRLTFSVDGKKTLSYEDLQRNFMKGGIALQVQGTATVVRFRKIQIRELTPPAREPKAEIRPAASPAQAAKGSVDLLKLVDPDKDARVGHWKMEKGVLICAPMKSAQIEFPYVPPEEYDFRVTFMREAGTESIEQICSAVGRRFNFIVGGWGNKISAFGLINGKMGNNNPTMVKADGWIVNGERYVMLVKVRKNGVEGYLNDTVVVRWPTNFTDMASHPWNKLQRGDTLGLLVFDNEARIESAEVDEITGEGKLLR